MENDIYKNRSISACIKASFDVLTINFATIFKKTWLGSLAWAICLTALVFFFGKFALTVTANEPSVWATAIPTLCAFLLSLTASSYMTASIVSLLFKHALKPIFLRAFITIILLTVISLAALIFVPEVSKGLAQLLSTSKLLSPIQAVIAGFVLFGLIILAILAFMLPLGYSLTHYICTPKAKLIQAFGKDYKVGLHHWGFLFIGQILTIFCAIMPLAFLALPLSILFMAYGYNLWGMLTLADPDGLPTYFIPMMIAFVGIICFIASYIFIYGVFTNIYVYGSVNQQINSK